MPVYRFRIKGNGSCGSVKFTDGMNVEVSVPKNCGPWDTRARDLFIQEFASKYNYEQDISKVSAIKMLFKRDRLDVQEM